MATRVLSGFCILFLLLSASHVLPSTEAARILDENKAAGDGITYPIIGPQPRPPGRCQGIYRHPYWCRPRPSPSPSPPPPVGFPPPPPT